MSVLPLSCCNPEGAVPTSRDIRQKLSVDVERPIGITVSPDGGTIYVAGHDGVSIFDKEGDLISLLTLPDGLSPLYLALSQQGELLVTDRSHSGLHRYSSDWVYIGTIIPLYGEGFLTGLDWSPLGVSVSRTGDILVTDVSTGLHRLVIVRNDGALISIIGSQGFGDGEFEYPNFAIEHDGRIYVSDSGNKRMQVFTSSHELIGKFSIGYRGSSLEMPLGIAAFENRLYIINRQPSAVAIFRMGDNLPEPISWFNAVNGNLDKLSSPAGIAVDDQGLLYIADSGNNRIVIWEWI